jgi:membrane associated rhomboid family serine protease
VSREREKIFNLPPVVSAVVFALAAIQLALVSLPEATAQLLFDRLAFVPARLSFLLAPQATLQALGASLAGELSADEIAAFLNGAGRAWWTPLTYALLHGGWAHLAINCITLAAFGSPVARRFGDARFLLLMTLCALAGAAAHLAVHPFDVAPVVGASAAISGTMAAVARFAFAHGGSLSEHPLHAEDEVLTKAQSLRDLVSNRRALFFLATWFGVNLAMGLLPQGSAAPGGIAWEAHIGGFIAGLLLFDWIDPIRRAAT